MSIAQVYAFAAQTKLINALNDPEKFTISRSPEFNYKVAIYTAVGPCDKAGDIKAVVETEGVYGVIYATKNPYEPTAVQFFDKHTGQPPKGFPDTLVVTTRPRTQIRYGLGNRRAQHLAGSTIGRNNVKATDFMAAIDQAAGLQHRFSFI